MLSKALPLDAALPAQLSTGGCSLKALPQDARMRMPSHTPRQSMRALLLVAAATALQNAKDYHGASYDAAPAGRSRSSVRRTDPRQEPAASIPDPGVRTWAHTYKYIRIADSVPTA